MTATIKALNEKTDDRFVYTIALFCLLSICLSQFPKQEKAPEITKKEIQVAALVTD